MIKRSQIQVTGVMGSAIDVNTFTSVTYVKSDDGLHYRLSSARNDKSPTPYIQLDEYFHSKCKEPCRLTIIGNLTSKKASTIQYDLKTHDTKEAQIVEVIGFQEK